ncbi:MAG: SH3 domain-containing protein [Sulfitobacter sp.]
MTRFILLTFGFLGWAFYEMSGGSDFESQSARMARLNPAPVVTVTPVKDTAEVVTADATTDVVDTDPPLSGSVTRVSLNLTSVKGAAAAAEQAQTAALTKANIDPESGVAVNTDTITSSADTPAIIPSLIAPNDNGTSTTTNTPAISDIRIVSGNRVNVRGGPGTDFSVVSRLARGDSVEILEDNGDGWVLMRPVDGGSEGWMADFLLTSG